MTTNQEKTIYYFDEDPGYETIQKITNGYFTTLSLTDGRIMFLNEAGEYTCEINNEASKIYNIKIYGKIVIIGKVN
jgi:hypothetical protein|tara:strand:- start:410 stop:637 length:228 start_codon:yes stop_codon:yes gene_type:complete